MSIRLRKTATASAIEDVAAAREQQSGSYEGPRVLSDEPARAVLDLAAYRPPVVPSYKIASPSVADGDTQHIDLVTGESKVGQFQLGNPDFGFVRAARLRRNNTGSSGNTNMRIRLYDYSGGVVNFLEFYRNVLSASDVFIGQLGWEGRDDSGPSDGIFLPADLVIPPDHRLVVIYANGTDGNDTVEAELWRYQFSGTDILI